MTSDQTEGQKKGPFALLPLCVGLEMVVWTLCWLCYDSIFDILHTNYIWLPIGVTGVAMIPVVIATVKPMVIVAGRISTTSKSANIVVIASTIIAAILGEIVYVSTRVIIQCPNLPLSRVLIAIPNIVGTYPTQYAFFKIALACLLVVASREQLERYWAAKRQ